jgi:hypothetical protein
MVHDPICSDPDPAHCLRVARARARFQLILTCS